MIVNQLKNYYIQMKAKFISFEYLTKWTQIDENIDPNILEPFIMQAQDINIQGVIGNSLYVKIMNDIATTGTTTGSYLTLLSSYIQPCQAQWTMYYALPFMNYRLTNKSVSEKNSDNSNPTTIENVQYLRSVVANTAEFLGKRIGEYICNNQNDFPEYFTTDYNSKSIKGSSDTYFSGIYLPKGC